MEEFIVDFSEENVGMEASEDIAEWYGDLSETLEEDELVDIASDVIENFEADKDSRGDWESMFERGFDLLGLKLEPGTEPFDGACTAVHPLLIESAVKFQSKASGELFPTSGPVKARIFGSVNSREGVAGQSCTELHELPAYRADAGIL